MYIVFILLSPINLGFVDNLSQPNAALEKGLSPSVPREASVPSVVQNNPDAVQSVSADRSKAKPKISRGFKALALTLGLAIGGILSLGGSLYGTGSFMTTNAPSPPQKVNVVAYLDATDAKLRASVTDGIRQLERAKARNPDSLEATAFIARTPDDFPSDIPFDFWTRLSLVTIGAGGAVYSLLRKKPASKWATAAAVSILSGLAISTAPATYSQAQMLFNVDNWHGKRVYTIASENSSYSTPVRSYTKASERTADFIRENTRPGYLNIFYTVGHGGHGELVQMPTRELDKVFSATGQVEKFEVMIFNSCSSTDLATLRVLSKHGEVAILSEGQIPVGIIGELLPNILQDASRHGRTPRRIGFETIEMVSPRLRELSFYPQIVSAINLREVPALDEAYSQFVNQCIQEEQQGNRQISAAVKRALEQSKEIDGNFKLNDNSPFLLSQLYQTRKIIDLDDNCIDLGDFLSRLSREDVPPSIERAIARVQNCLSNVVIAKAASPGYDSLSGVSIYVPRKPSNIEVSLRFPN